MFERFTDTTRRVVVLAQEEARYLKHNYIGVEHLLLGILTAAEQSAAKGQQIESVGIQILNDLGMTARWTRDEIVRRVGTSPAPSGQHIPFTPRTKKVLENALREAVKLGHSMIEVDHMFLGMLMEKDSLALPLLDAVLHGSMTLDQFKEELTEGLKALLQDAPRGRQAVGAQMSPGPGAAPQGRKGTLLEEFGTNLTKDAAEGKLDPVVGREREMGRVIRILGRRTKNNPILIGDPGVGKTAIIEGLAQRIAAGDVPSKLRETKLYTLELGRLVAGAKYRGDFEERLNKVIKEVADDPNIILFIDEIHTLIGAGAAEGAVDASSILKPKLARGELRVIGATTHDEYVKHFEKDAALDRRFQPIDVDEPSAEEAKQILEGVSRKFEEFHGVTYTPEALEAAVDLSVQYLTKRFLPDKAIDLIDEAASHVVNTREEVTTITEDDIVEVLEGWTGGQIRRAKGAEARALRDLESILGQRVVGQDEGISALARAVRRGRVGLKDPRRPQGSFVFLGPSGVGKTETAKALASYLYGDDDALVVLDMSEYMEKHTVARLYGAPPGYVGHDEGGQLTEAVRRKPFSVVLFDEIEKAHPDVFNALLQILEEGRLTDSQGRKVDFTNTVVIMTSNIGTGELKKRGVGFVTPKDSEGYERLKSVMLASFKSAVRPEFLNRIDEVIVFRQLDSDDLVHIVELMVAEVSERLAASMATELVLTDDALAHLARQGGDPELGARPLRRAIQRLIEDKLSTMILDEEIVNQSSVVVDTVEKDGGTELVFSVIRPEMHPEPVGAEGLSEL